MMTIHHYYAIAEPDDSGGFWISFPGRDGLTSAADDAGQIVAQAQDALATALIHEDGSLPPAIEDGATPPLDLDEYENPLVVVIPFELITANEAA